MCANIPTSFWPGNPSGKINLFKNSHLVFGLGQEPRYQTYPPFWNCDFRRQKQHPHTYHTTAYARKTSSYQVKIQLLQFGDLAADRRSFRSSQYTYKVCIQMKTIRIQYNHEKNVTNQKKNRGISLADAETVFYDDSALTLEDRDHAEERWVTLGKNTAGQLLVVAYTYRDPHFIRIISARLASKNECRQYLEA